MPGVRSRGQTMIGCWCEQALVEKIDRARRTRSRSEFCREALAEKLRSMGVEVAEHEAASPDRAGKGRVKRGLYPLSAETAQLNESGQGTAGKKTGPGTKSKP